MKILIISDAWKPQINGVVRTYEYIIDELHDMGHETMVIGPADFPVRIPMPGYKEIELAINPYGRLKRMIDKFGPDYIHIATEGPLGLAGSKYCKKNDIKFTTSYHTHFPDYVSKRVAKYLPFLKNITRKLAINNVKNFHNKASGIMIATQSLEDELKSWGFTAPMHRLTRGVSLDIFYPDEAELFHDLPRPIAIYVGRIAIEKNLEDFLDMDWDGSKVIVGIGPDLEYLEKTYPDAHFVGKKIGHELGAHYRSADIFVFPSKTDTFGMVLIEALASGIPVAAYNVTGPKDIITEDYLGALHDDKLHIAAQKAMEHSHARKERRQHIEENYTWPTVAEQFLYVIEVSDQ